MPLYFRILAGFLMVSGAIAFWAVPSELRADVLTWNLAVGVVLIGLFLIERRFSSPVRTRWCCGRYGHEHRTRWQAWLCYALHYTWEHITAQE